MWTKLINKITGNVYGLYRDGTLPVYSGDKYYTEPLGDTEQPLLEEPLHGDEVVKAIKTLFRSSKNISQQYALMKALGLLLDLIKDKGVLTSIEYIEILDLMELEATNSELLSAEEIAGIRYQLEQLGMTKRLD